MMHVPCVTIHSLSRSSVIQIFIFGAGLEFPCIVVDMHVADAVENSVEHSQLVVVYDLTR